jgi:hypothetical protein
MKQFDKVDLKVIESIKKGNNCAQTVFYYFQDEHGHTDEKIKSHYVNGGGRAPNNLCGALYAAQELLKEQEKENMISELNKQFNENIGGITCSDIRGNNLAPCIVCKDVAIKIVKDLLKECY